MAHNTSIKVLLFISRAQVNPAVNPNPTILLLTLVYSNFVVIKTVTTHKIYCITYGIQGRQPRDKKIIIEEA